MMQMTLLSDITLEQTQSGNRSETYGARKKCNVNEHTVHVWCITDNVDCCGYAQGQVKGDWYFPNHTRVGSVTENIYSGRSNNLFARNRDQSVVRLRRIGNPPERGHFYCEVPNSHGINQTIFINICELIILSM